MSDETKLWEAFNHKLDEQASLLKQIVEAEEQKKMRYFISVSRSFLEIEYGLLKKGGFPLLEEGSIHIFLTQDTRLL